MNSKGNSVFWGDLIAWGMIIGILILAYTSAGRFNTLMAHGGIFAFVPLVILFFSHVDWMQALKNRDKELITCLVVGGLVVINMRISKAGIGVVFDIANLILILFLSDKIKLTIAIQYMIAIGCMVVMLFWIVGDGSSYNPNTFSMIIFEMAILSILCGFSILEKKNKIWMGYLYSFITILMFVWPIAKKYAGRTTMVAILIIVVLFFVMPKKIWSIRWCYYCLMYGTALASLIVPVIFTRIYFSYVDRELPIPQNLLIFTGRGPVWQQFLDAWKKEPWTGIGNDYVSKIPDIFYKNIHNGLLHILIVYGIVVFLITIVLLWKKIMKIKTDEISAAKRFGLSVIVAMLAMMTMESYIITPFSNLIFFIVLSMLFQEQV